MPSGGQAPDSPLTCCRGVFPVNGLCQVVPGLGCFRRPVLEAGSVGQRAAQSSDRCEEISVAGLTGHVGTYRNSQLHCWKGKGVSRGAVMVAAEGRGQFTSRRGWRAVQCRRQTGESARPS